MMRSLLLRSLLLLSGWALSLAAQPALVLTGPASAPAGSVVQVDVSVRSTGGLALTGLEIALTAPPGTVVTAGNASLVALKSAACQSGVCLTYGLDNTHVYADGVVLVLSVALPPGGFTFGAAGIATSAAAEGVGLGTAGPLTVAAAGVPPPPPPVHHHHHHG